MTTEHLIVFIIFVVVIVPLALWGLVIAGVIVVQNWRPIIYMAGAMFTMALIAAACHALSGQGT